MKLGACVVAVGLVVAASACSDGDEGADASTTSTAASPATPAPADVSPPEVPDDFTWTGRYVVPDLDVEVPFTWHGRDGDFQMVAGGDDHPIHFTNLIVDGQLYTLTYEWPDVPRNPCSHVGAFTVDDLNEGLAEARYVGRETLHEDQDRLVDHFRTSSVWEPSADEVPPIPGVPQLRIPLMSGDIYVDATDPTQFRKVLQFGLQNLYDPSLDEWIVIDETDPAPGEVALPEECTPDAG